jgi:hypothetical protein
VTRVLEWIEVVQVRTSELHDGFTEKQEIFCKAEQLLASQQGLVKVKVPFLPCMS